ncbi:hypothetical protein B0O99DRAFT_55445 [Bisporella sp. PMI_857]|nr:hypothetical protein B0O99DRAFT_55445 [Bisporella sp. PMI_857]
MNSDPPPTTRPASSKEPPDLEYLQRIFEHPEGLNTARLLVRIVIGLQRKSTVGQTISQIVPTPVNSFSEYLMFSDNQFTSISASSTMESRLGVGHDTGQQNLGESGGSPATHLTIASSSSPYLSSTSNNNPFIENNVATNGASQPQSLKNRQLLPRTLSSSPAPRLLAPAPQPDLCTRVPVKIAPKKRKIDEKAKKDTIDPVKSKKVSSIHVKRALVY